MMSQLGTWGQSVRTKWPHDLDAPRGVWEEGKPKSNDEGPDKLDTTWNTIHCQGKDVRMDASGTSWRRLGALSGSLDLPEGTGGAEVFRGIYHNSSL